MSNTKPKEYSTHCGCDSKPKSTVKANCSCGPNCTCGDNCTCTPENHCNADCHCGS